MIRAESYRKTESQTIVSYEKESDSESKNKEQKKFFHIVIVKFPSKHATVLNVIQKTK